MKNDFHNAVDPSHGGRPDRPGNGDERDHYPKSLAVDLMVNLHVFPIAYRVSTPILPLTGDPMKPILPFVIACFFATGSTAQTVIVPGPETLFVEMDDVDLNQFKWKKRPVVVFSDSENNNAFIEQMELLAARPGELIERDVVVIIDTNPEARSELRRKLRPREFMLVIMGKDGGVKLRKPFPWDVREISRSIDKMPVRQREIRQEKERAAEQQ
ncbi:DUF4174 domain-containing protein [Roseobacter fucihabitans]|nr:DUF4174 domain-containing protein [Roseobacter litoralis]